jgi:pyocin large subunit-like protein
VTGLFLSQDPVFLAIGNPKQLKNLTGMDQQKYLMDPQALNSYSYARQNPLKYIDPNGNWFETAFDVAMFSLSVNDFKRDPGFWTGFSVLADGASIVLPIPALVGAARHADDVGKAAKNINRARESGQNIAKFGLEYAKNIGFKMDSRIWSQGELGDGLGSLVDHYLKHGDQVGVRSVSEYYDKANIIINSADNKNIFKISNLYGPGTTDYFDRATNNIVGLNSKGEISTFHKVTDQGKLSGIMNAIK